MNRQQANGVLRLARWLPVLTCIPLVAEAAVMYAQGQIGWPSTAIALLMTLACLSIALQTGFAWLVVFLWLVEQVMPFPVTTSSILPLLAALLILGYISVIQGVIASLIASVAYLPELAQGGGADMPIDTILIQFAFFLLATGSGIIWSSHQRRTEREQRRVGQTYQRNALRVADRLHNSVANDLVYLDRVLAGGNLSADQIKQARNVVFSALDKVHQVIDELAVSTPDDAGAPDPHHPHQQEQLRQLFSSWDRKLAEADFTGGSLMDEHIDLTWMNQQDGDSVTGMIDEIYGNILKHADRNNGYCVSLTDNGSQLEISVVDAPANPQRDNRHQGTGITRCRRLAAGLRGTLDLSEDEHQWNMTITIPHPDASADYLPQWHQGQ